MAALEAEKKCLSQQLQKVQNELNTVSQQNEYFQQIADRAVQEARKQSEAYDTIQRKYDSLTDERNALITVLDATNARATALNAQLQAVEVVSNERDEAIATLKKQLQHLISTTAINETVDPECRKLYQHLRTRDDLQSLCDHIDGQIAYLELKSKKQNIVLLLDELRAARGHLPQMIEQHEHAIKVLENRIVAKNDHLIQEKIKHSHISKRFCDEPLEAQLSVLQPLSDLNRHSKIISSPQSHLTKHPNTPNRLYSNYISDENVAPLLVL